MNSKILTESDLQSHIWQNIKKFLNAELSVLREKNERMLPEIETANIRGKISMIKKVLNLEEGAKAPEQITGNNQL